MVKLPRLVNTICGVMQSGAARMGVRMRRSEVIMEVCMLDVDLMLDRCLGLW